MTLRTDTTARIPFAILGIFLLLASSTASLLIIHHHTQTIPSAANILDLNAVTRLRQTAETDLAAALNRIATQALTRIGRTPVTHPLKGTTDTILYDRLRHAILPNLTQYLLAQYTDDTHTDGTYALNIPLTNDTPDLTPDQITVTTHPLTLHRTTIPYLGPPPTTTSPAYLTATLPLTFTLTIHHHPTNHTEHATITTLITSRYPLLDRLTTDYQTSLSATPGPLWTFTTTTAILYTQLRAWKHHPTGNPANIVDNHHLALLLNAGLQLTTALTYHSIDPLALLSLLSHTKTTLAQPTPTPLQAFNQQTTPTGATYPTTTITHDTANLDAGDPTNTTIPTGPPLTLTDIADPILHTTTSLTLHYHRPPHDTTTDTIPYDTHTAQHITDSLTTHHAQGWSLTTITKTQTNNHTTTATLQTLAATIYRDQMHLLVANRIRAAYHTNPPGPPWHDGPIGPWTPTHLLPGPKHTTIPPKGTVTPGAALADEHYTVTYHRTHSYWNTTGNTTQWDNRTDTLTENITLTTILDWTGLINNTHDDITDILYHNTTLADPNLHDTLAAYQTTHPDSQPEKQRLITTRNNTGTTSLTTTINGTIPPWVIPEAWHALNDILYTLQTLTTNCNATTYPYPPTLIDHALADLTTQLADHLHGTLGYPLYHPGAAYLSVGKKTVYCAASGSSPPSTPPSAKPAPSSKKNSTTPSPTPSPRQATTPPPPSTTPSPTPPTPSKKNSRSPSPHP